MYFNCSIALRKERDVGSVPCGRWGYCARIVSEQPINLVLVCCQSTPTQQSVIRFTSLILCRSSIVLNQSCWLLVCYLSMLELQYRHTERLCVLNYAEIVHALSSSTTQKAHIYRVDISVAHSFCPLIMHCMISDHSTFPLHWSMSALEY